MSKTLFTVCAFRYGGHSNTFPIGVFSSLDEAEKAAKDHRAFRGAKYSHRIYEFDLDKCDDDIGHEANNRPCIEDKHTPQLKDVETIDKVMQRAWDERNKLALYALRLNAQLTNIIDISCESCDLDMSSAGPEAIKKANELIVETYEYIENLK